MKFKEYITKDNQTIESFIKRVQDECKQFLSTIKPIIGTKKAFIRRMRKNNKKILKIIPRTDRRPLDMNREFHDAFDNAFKEKFGWKARSEGVFSYPVINYKRIQGHFYFIYSVGNFKFLYSVEVNDLYHSVSEFYDPIEVVDRFIDSYTDKNLLNVFKTSGEDYKNEVMFKCSQYYAFSNTYENIKLLVENKLL